MLNGFVGGAAAKRMVNIYDVIKIGWKYGK
jgi:hypothetical protein